MSRKGHTGAREIVRSFRFAPMSRQSSSPPRFRIRANDDIDDLITTSRLARQES